MRLKKNLKRDEHRPDHCLAHIEKQKEGNFRNSKLERKSFQLCVPENFRYFCVNFTVEVPVNTPGKFRSPGQFRYFFQLFFK